MVEFFLFYLLIELWTRVNGSLILWRRHTAEAAGQAGCRVRGSLWGRALCCTL